MLKHLIIAIALTLANLLPALAQDVVEPAGQPVDVAKIQVVDARVSSTEERARLILDLSALTEFAVVSLVDPQRIAVDVRADDIGKLTKTVVAGQGIVADFKVELVEKGRVRTWLNLATPAKVQQAYLLEPYDDQPGRLVVDLIPSTDGEFSARAALDLAAANAGTGGESQADISRVDIRARPLIVIDPGHGGFDSGAASDNGIKEKNVVLAFSKILQRMLVDTGKFDVALTRDADSYLKLEERVALARQNKADLFISIHADYFQEEDIRGASIYIRDEQATDVLDKVLAEKENRVDIIAGFAVPQMESKVVSILVDLMRREMRREAFRAAQTIVEQLEPSVKLRRHPVRQADFMVLQAPDVPSILVELGFMSNASDIANLTTPAWRDRVAEALARGIAVYFDGFVQR